MQKVCTKHAWTLERVLERIKYKGAPIHDIKAYGGVVV
jgi:hypothetical protein